MKLGFTELHRLGGDIHLGMRLAGDPPRPPRSLTAGVIEGAPRCAAGEGSAPARRTR
jgi:hypothetical protein